MVVTLATLFAMVAIVLLALLLVIWGLFRRQFSHESWEMKAFASWAWLSKELKSMGAADSDLQWVQEHIQSLSFSFVEHDNVLLTAEWLRLQRMAESGDFWLIFRMERFGRHYAKFVKAQRRLQAGSEPAFKVNPI